jgi:hypothetical protein
MTGTKRNQNSFLANQSRNSRKEKPERSPALLGAFPFPAFLGFLFAVMNGGSEAREWHARKLQLHSREEARISLVIISLFNLANPRLEGDIPKKGLFLGCLTLL